MLVTSVHDPAIFDEACFTANEYYEGLIHAHLQQMIRCHLVVRNSASSPIWNGILARVPNLPGRIQDLLRAIPINRILHLPAPRSSIATWLNDAGSVAAANVVACHSDIDVFVGATDTLFAMAQEGICGAIATSLQEYHLHPCAEVERYSSGGQSLKGLSTTVILDKIVNPAIRWARRVSIIDRHLGRSVKESNSNSDAFRDMVAAILRQWKRGPGSRDRNAEFQIVTGSYEGCDLGDRLAESIAQKLGLASESKAVVMLKAGKTIADHKLFHDRYLQTDQDVTIGFTRGFDLTPGARCDAYLFCGTEGENTATDILTSREYGRYPSGR
jgi:hypothetical protein